MKKTFGEYYLGLDIGTDSLGWAVTDLNYHLQKLNGKAMWGIRLFESGKTAADRRIHRAARRRQQRKVQRIKLLQELFSEEISKVDPGFFLRLKESKYHPEDKSQKQPYALFVDDGFNDKDYHVKYPTIYHLRRALIEGKERFDIRLVYLAIHYIIKNRGHFLFEGRTMENITSFPEVFQDLKQSLLNELELELECESLEEAEGILKSQDLGITEKKKRLEKLFYANTKPEAKQIKAICGLLAGGRVKLSEVFDEQALDEAEVNKLCFESEEFETNRDQLTRILEDKMFCLEKLKAIYDWSILANIRRGEKYLSYTKTAEYDKHKQDLQILKRVVKTYCSKVQYKEIFSDETVSNNYCAYIYMSKKNNKKVPINKKCTQEDLCKYLKGILKDIKTEDPDYLYIMKELENNRLLPKQITKDNGVIPYQMHLEELEVILENASQYLDFLNKADGTGYTVKEKIKFILTFRIPYYVGPLNDAHKEKGNCWIVKRSNEKIRPWNFEQVVDLEASAEGFIRRMTNKCTYLIGEDVLPKNSLLYSKFMVLNELNNLKLNGDKITVALKQKIYTELFMRYSKVTQKKLVSYLKGEGVIENPEEISGIDGDFKASLTSYIDFARRIGDKVKQHQMVEDMISWIVLFGDDRKLLEKRIRSYYGDKLTEDEIKSIISLRYSGWGRLSKEFLEEIIHVDKATGECMSIISALWQTNDNLMQLLSSRYDYLDEIMKYNAEEAGVPSEITYDVVDDLYVSPAVKRSIWQTLLIVKEVAKIMQSQPKKIFVEVTRSEAEKKRTKSRKDILVDLYKNCKAEERNWVEELTERSEGDLRSDRLYLYYTQMGKCMYSGESIKLADLYDNNLYDIDHIFPRSKTKDDSLENRVLVKKTINAAKLDKYPLPKEIQEKCKGLWTGLFHKGLIGKKKYERLTRTTQFDDDELAGFIARQIVETSQSTKAVAEILSKVFDKSEVVYVKAGNVSDFRQKSDLIKVREINDYHHAKDAYLNIVVGNVYNTKFTHSPVNFIKKHNGRDYNLYRMYKHDVERDGILAWRAGENGTICDLKKVMAKNNILFTRYATKFKGQVSDQNLSKKRKDLLPIKSSNPKLCDTEKYGGYDSIKGAYYMLVEHLEKKKRIRTIEHVPVHLAKQLEGNMQAEIEYCKSNLKLIEPTILLSKIKTNTLFQVNGFRMHLSSRTVDQIVFKGAHQLCIGKEDEAYLKKVFKYINRLKQVKGELPITSYDGISFKQNIKIYDLFMNKLENTVYGVRLSSQVKNLENGRAKFEKLTLSDQCKLLEGALHLFQCNSVNADLRLIGGGKNSGLIKISKNITNAKNHEVKIINQSPTGIFTREIDLLKL